MKCALQFQRNVSNIDRYAGKLHNKAVSNLGVFPKKNCLNLSSFQNFCSIETQKNYLLNLVLLGFSSADPSPEENGDKFIQGKFLARSFDFFSSKRQLSIFFNFHFSFVHFIGAFY